MGVFDSGFRWVSPNPLMELDHAVERAIFAGTRGWIVALEPFRKEVSKTGSRILLIDPADGEVRASVSTSNRRNALAVSPDRTLVAVAGDDQVIVILDADSLAERHRFRAHAAAITALRFHPSKPIIASGSMDHSVKLWDYTKVRPQQTFLGIGGRPVMISFSPSGHLLCVDGMEHAFRIFESADETG